MCAPLKVGYGRGCGFDRANKFVGGAPKPLIIADEHKLFRVLC
jgi:hypothetical protein